MLAASLESAQELSKEAKIRRIVNLTGSDATMKQMFDQIKTSLRPPGVAPEQQAKFQETQSRIFDLMRTRLSWEKMRQQYVKIYSETFTDKEIDGILALYESPAGRAFTEKMPTMVPKMLSFVQAQMSDLMPEIQRISREGLQK
jgi:uncharacterized protein